MSSFLKNHPFAVDAFFDSSTVLAYAVPKEELEKLIPECLEIDTFDNKWGFVAMAMVQTKHLRPKGFPKFMGNDFFLIGFRIFVRYTTSTGKRLRGLYIIKSFLSCLFSLCGRVFILNQYALTPRNFHRFSKTTRKKIALIITSFFFFSRMHRNGEY